MRMILLAWLVVTAGCVWAGSAFVSLPEQVRTIITDGNGQVEMDLQADQAALQIGEARVAATLGTATGHDGGDPRAGWPNADETGVLATLTPDGVGLRFTTGYLSAPCTVGTGATWTLACWVRPDDPDWGTVIQRDHRVKPLVMRPIIVALDGKDGALWRLRLCHMRPEIEIGTWRAIGSTRLPVGRWTYLAVERRGDDVRLYVNGQHENLLPAPGVDDTPAPVALAPVPAAKADPAPVLRLAGSPLGALSLNGAASLREQFIGAMGSVALYDYMLGDQFFGKYYNDTMRDFPRRPSVLDDPLIGARSHHALRQEETPAQFRARTAWWREGKFGLFLHWGPSTLTKKEISWSRGTGKDQTPPDVYDNLYKQYNPDKYDPVAWAAQAKAAGMRYAVLITKHHDGFCEWPTKTNAYNIAHTPYGKDVVDPYAVAMRGAGIKVGFYFSGPDWWHDDVVTKEKGRDAAVQARGAYSSAQVQELCTQYGTVDLLWFDGWGAYFDGMATAQPNLLINDRGGPGDYTTPENYMADRPLLNPNGSDMPWETCSGTGGYWGYASDKPYISTAQAIRYLAEVVAKGGNWLCNVAPRETGELPASHMAMLKGVGDWLAVNGASIYGTHRTHLGRQPWGWTTANDTTLFLHVLTWPGKTLTLPDLYDRATAVTFLATGAKLPFSQEQHTLTITLPATAPDPADTVIAVQVTRTAPARVVDKGRYVNRTAGGTAAASGDYPPTQAAAQAFDNRLDTKWFDPYHATGWLQVQFGDGAAWAVTRYMLVSGGDIPERDPKDWQLQGSQDGAAWTTLDTQTGQEFPARCAVRAYQVANTTAYRYYRLLITANHGAGGVQLTEVRLFTYLPPGN